MDVSDKRVLRRLDPVTVFGDLAVDAKGAKDGESAGRRFVDALNDALADATEVQAATFDEPCGGCMAIDGGARREAVIAFDSGLRAPTDEVGFDGVDFGMVTDDAFAGVTREGGIGLAADGDFGAGGVGESARELFGVATRLLLLEFGAGDERGFVFERAVAFGDCLGVAAGVARGENFAKFGGDADLDWAVVLRQVGHGWYISLCH